MTVKILFASVPADGHFNPLARLASHLKKKGFDVRWYTQDLYKSRIEKMGIPYYPFKRPPQLNQFNFEDYFAGRKELQGQVAKMKFDIEHVFIRRIPEFFEDIKEIYEDFPFDLFISDLFFTAIPLVKEKLKVPVIAVGIVPLMETSRDLPPPGLGLLPSGGFATKIKQSVLRMVTNIFVFSKLNKLMRAILRSYNVGAPHGNIFDILYRSASLVMQIGTPGFEYYRSDMSQNIRFIGPLLPCNERDKARYKLSPDYWHYSKKILVTQGTVEKNPEKIIIPTLEAFRGSNVLIIATTGGSQTKELRAKYPDVNFLIEDFIPFDDIMPECDVFITNGGYGGVLFAIRNRLPLLAAGRHEGKNEINARIGYFKLGINLKKETPSPSLVKKGVENILKNKAYRDNVSSLAKEFEKYDPILLCEKYLSELLSEQKRSTASNP